MLKASEIDVDSILEILPAQTTLEVASEFLKAKELDYSASSWDQMIGERIRPALENGDISSIDLAEFAREAEEHGNQHVFLFSVADKSKIDGLFDPAKLKRRVSGLAGWPELNIPSIAERTQRPTIVEVRLEGNGRNAELVVKTVEPRKYKRKKREKETDTQITVVYDVINYRAVNIARLKANGELDIRIFSHKQNTSYDRDVQSVWKFLTGLISRGHFSDFSVLALKDALWDENYRKNMQQKVSVRNSQLLNLKGNRLRVASGTVQGNLWDDRGLFKGVNQFSNGAQGPDCEFANLALLHAASDGALKRDIGLTLKGAPNEFILPSHVNRTEYEHALKFVRQRVKS